MENDITLAWAVSVDYAKLGARLEAYVETKAQITTLKACVASSCSTHPSISKLPPEIVTAIANALKDIVYVPKIKRWLRAQKCVHNECERVDHFTKQELWKYESWSELPLEEDDDILYQDSLERHQDAVYQHLDKITQPVSHKFATRFAKAKKVSSSANQL